MSLRTFRCRAVLAASAWILLSGLAQAGTVDVRAPPNGAYSLKVTSLKEARFKTTVRQQYDFSCGSAATATLLTYQYGHPVTEAEVFMHMYQTGDQAKIRQRGFSLLDMRRYLRSLGFEADGFEQPLDKLVAEGLPAIVLLNDRGYRHFVVVKGFRNERVLPRAVRVRCRALASRSCGTTASCSLCTTAATGRSSTWRRTGAPRRRRRWMRASPATASTTS